MMGGFCIVNALLWEISEGFAIKDASFEPGIFCWKVVEAVWVPHSTSFIMLVDN